MKDAESTRVREVFEAVIECNPDSIGVFLDEMCGVDRRLRSRVEHLLHAHESAGEFLDNPMMRIHEVLDTAQPFDSFVGMEIGQFQVEEVIAAGGMGVVYRAKQAQPSREVALKILNHGLRSRTARQRFKLETEVLGRLQHPGIARIYDAGVYFEDSSKSERLGYPYFAMEYLPDALSVTEYANRHKMPLDGRLRTMMHVCDAVHHGHQRGIIHRDLKPSNILTDASGEVKVIDFGVARMTSTDHTLTAQFTDIGQLIGTVQYMSPEQCSLDVNDIDIRSDVYSLGIVLYELLCGQLPYDVSSQSIYQATETIRNTEPRRLSATNAALRGDLETIARTALAKDRNERYQSAADLGRDLERFTQNEPILARPPSTVYRFRKFSQRNRASVAMAIVAVIVILAGFTSLAIWNVRLNRARQDADAVFDFLQNVFSRAVAFPTGSVADWSVDMGDLSKQIDSAFDGHPLREAQVRYFFGRLYLDLGRPIESIDHQRQALDILRSMVDADDILLLRYLIDVGSSSVQATLYPEAEEATREALMFARRNAPRFEPGILDVLGQALRGQGRLDESLAATSEARERLALKSMDSSTSAKDDLSLVLADLDRLDEAEELSRQCFAYRRDRYGADHRHTLWSNHNYGLILRQLGRVSEARRLHKECYEKRLVYLGPLHHFTLLAKTNYAIVLALSGEDTEAEKLLTECLVDQRRILVEHEDIQTSLLALIDLCLREDRNDDAQPFINEFIQMSRRYLGEDQQWTLACMSRVVRFLVESERIDDARQLANFILEIRLLQFGEDHIHTARARTLVEFVSDAGETNEG